MRAIKILAAALMTMLSVYEASAVPARPRPFTVTQPDGSKITLVMHGDEFLNWMTDTGGKCMVRDADGFFRNGPAPGQAEISAARTLRRSVNEGNVASPGFSLRSFTNGTGNFLVVLVQWNDLKFTVSNPLDSFSALLNAPGYSTGGATGSARDYFIDNSLGKFQPDFDVVGPVTLDCDHDDFVSSDPSNHSRSAESFFYRSLVAIDESIDFSQYDNDGDSRLDNVFFFFAGHNKAEGGGDDTIWPHKWNFANHSGSKLDGLRLGTYACTSEYQLDQGTTLAGIGTFCHEFSHVLGLPDVYDTDKEANGEASHPGAFDLMGSGNYNGENMCPPYYTFEERLRLGWVEEREICSISGDVELGTVDKNKAMYIPTSQEGEYFILESRGGQKWDAALPVGVTVMHLDTSLRNVHGKTAKARYEAGDGINCFEDHPCYYPVPSMEGSQLREDLLFPGSHKVTSLLTSDWNGQETFYLSAISANAQGATLRLDFSTSYLYGKVTLPDGKAVEGALVSADPVQQSQSSPAPRILSPRGARFSAVTDSEGKYMIALEGCSHGDILEISASKDGYIPGVQTITVAPGRQEANLGMKLIIDFQETDLKKYASVSNTWSTWKFIENGNYDGLTTGIKFSADELSSEAGKIIRSASMFIDADSIGELLFKVQSGAETVLRKVLPDPQAGGWLSVDIEEEGLRIPSDQDVWFIFSFRNTSGLKIRLGLTDGREGGYLFCTGFDKEGKNLYSSPSSATYSFLTGVSLRSDGVIGEGVTVSDLGFNYIVPPSGVLSQGAEYIPSLAVSSSSKPTSVSWTLDGDPVPASGFILSSGRHILKATMSFQDAHVETSEVVLPVQ